MLQFFCEPLCVEDMIGCTISGLADDIKGAGGRALKDELCHVLVGALDAAMNCRPAMANRFFLITLIVQILWE